MPLPSRSLPSSLALSFLAFSMAAGQANYKGFGQRSAAQAALPAHGPASTRLNPAAAAEGRLAAVHLAALGTQAGKGPAPFYQATVALPLGEAFPFSLSAGLGGFSMGEQVDNSTASYAEDVITPTLALSLCREEAGIALAAVGLSLPIYTFNAFNVVKSHAVGMDLGVLAAFRMGGSTLRLGAAWQHLLAPEMKLPDRGTYEIPGQILYAAGWSSPGNLLSTRWEWYTELATDREAVNVERFGLGGWEIEACPIPGASWLGLKYERVRLGSLNSFGLLFHPTFDRFGPRFEAAFGHDELGHPESLDWLLGEAVEEGRGLHLALTLGLEIH